MAWVLPEHVRALRATQRAFRVSDDEVAAAAGISTRELLQALGGRAPLPFSVDELFERVWPASGSPRRLSWREVLGVGETRDLEVIRARFRQLAREQHPDAGGATERMQAINAAWEAARAELAPPRLSPEQGEVIAAIAGVMGIAETELAEAVGVSRRKLRLILDGREDLPPWWRRDLRDLFTHRRAAHLVREGSHFRLLRELGVPLQQ